MKEHTLKITANNKMAVVERLMQVTRYRGFMIIAFNMNLNEVNEFNILLKVQSNKPIEKLYVQLSKLFDVSNVCVSQSENQAISK